MVEETTLVEEHILVEETILVEESILEEVEDHDLNEIMDMYSCVVLEDETDNSKQEFDDSKIDTQDLLKTYASLYMEKMSIEKLLKETVESLNTKNSELITKDRKLSILLEDNVYLRTENQKLKNKLKAINQHADLQVMCDGKDESNSDNDDNLFPNLCDTVEENEFCRKTYKELNDLREELAEFKIFMYNELRHGVETSSQETGCRTVTSIETQTDEQCDILAEIEELNGILKGIQKSIEPVQQVPPDADHEEEEMTVVKHKKLRKRKGEQKEKKKVPPSVPLHNRFAPLRFVANNNFDKVELETDDTSGPEHVEPINHVSSSSSTNTATASIPILMPGIDTYSQVVVDGGKTAIFSSSITRHIDMKQFNKDLVAGKAVLNKFHGGHIKHIKNYIHTHLSEQKANCAIILAGGNDLSNEHTAILDVANNIIEAGVNCRKYGSSKVIISGVLPREDFYYQLRRHELNKLLRGLCELNNFTYMDQGNIVLSDHICWDGVHLNKMGTNVLRQNLLDQL